jgi:hypothetical protein
VTIDATSGFYDWVRKRTRTSTGQNQFQIRDLGINAGTVLCVPPEYVLAPLPLIPGEFGMAFLKVYMAIPTGPAPELDQHLIPADRTRLIQGLGQNNYTSTPGFISK